MNIEIGSRNLTRFWSAAAEPGDLLVWATRIEPRVAAGETLVFTFAGAPVAVSRLLEIVPPGVEISGRWKEHWKLLHRRDDFIDLRRGGRSGK